MKRWIASPHSLRSSPQVHIVIALVIIKAVTVGMIATRIAMGIFKGQPCGARKHGWKVDRPPTAGYIVIGFRGPWEPCRHLGSVLGTAGVVTYR